MHLIRGWHLLCRKENIISFSLVVIDYCSAIQVEITAINGDAVRIQYSREHVLHILYCLIISVFSGKYSRTFDGCSHMSSRLWGTVIQALLTLVKRSHKIDNRECIPHISDCSKMSGVCLDDILRKNRTNLALFDDLGAEIVLNLLRNYFRSLVVVLWLEVYMTRN